MRIIGKTPIHPFFFFSGKISGYILWMLMIPAVFHWIDISEIYLPFLQKVSWFTYMMGWIFTILSLTNLGKSTSLGLPKEGTAFIRKGLYKFSRNPMYLGFNLLTLSSILYFQNLYILIAGLYCIGIYHFIILSEERFLTQRFGEDYLVYKASVRRYL